MYWDISDLNIFPAIWIAFIVVCVKIFRCCLRGINKNNSDIWLSEDSLENISSCTDDSTESLIDHGERREKSLQTEDWEASEGHSLYYDHDVSKK